MKRRKEQPEKLKREYRRPALRLRRAFFADGEYHCLQFRKSITEQHLLITEFEESEETSSVEKEHPEENLEDEENTEKIVEEENSAAEDFYEEDSEKDTEEVSEEKPFQKHSTENHVEENARISEEETVAAKGPTASEEDEWLYSQPRRFAKKPAHEQED